MKTKSDYEAFLQEQILGFFGSEPHTVKEYAEAFNIKYGTAFKRTRRMLDIGQLVFVNRNANHENVYRTATSDNLPRIRMGEKPGGASQLYKADALLDSLTNTIRQGKGAGSLAKLGREYASKLAYFLYSRVTTAKADYVAGEDEIAIEYRKYLLTYLAMLDRRREDIKQLLDHPYLWNEAIVRKWAGEFDERALANYERLIEESANK